MWSIRMEKFREPEKWTINSTRSELYMNAGTYQHKDAFSLQTAKPFNLTSLP
ncbi:hypothetical protein H8959_009989 [Pygathrix nigripes]